MTTTTTAPRVKNNKDYSFGLVETGIVSSINDFTQSKLNESELDNENEKENFPNTFICHLIFYAFLCVSLILHILIDHGLGSFIRNKFVQLIRVKKIGAFEKDPAFA